ncbi:MAG: hypothetical protein KF861_00475 [Planctomycetaceae bacterium]|nr:hypothetical protein [Planctomycetaceae bacterium]
MAAKSTRAGEFKNALFAAAKTMWATTEPEVQVAFGHPGKTQVDDIVALGRVTSRQDPATLSTNRSREEVLTVEVMFSIYRGGTGNDVEQACSDRGYKLLDDLAEYVRVTDTTVGGTVRECFLTSVDSEGETDASVLAKGRLIETLATFTAVTRITS